MKKLSIFLAFLLFISFQAAAQMQITGTVTGADDGLSIPGVSIIVKDNSTIGTTTDIDGKYSLTVPSDTETLIFSFVGMKTTEVLIEGRSVINIQLESEVLAMDEVIVVGYGTQSKRLITGSVASVGAAELENEVIQGIDNALQGRMTGVRVSSNSGTPGGGISVRIRGASSILAGNEPLYIIDGVPINTGDYSQEAYGGQDLNATTSINPNDIEDIQVLKDASYAAIYGARAANGVVLITTKTGKSGKAKINFSLSTGTQQMIKKRDLLNSEQYVLAMNEALFNSFGLVDYLGSPDDYEADTDWQDEVTQVAPISEYQLSISGGNEMINYYVSGGYMDQDGIVIGSDYERISGRVNMDVKATDKLKLGTRIQMSKENINRIYGDNNIYAPLANAYAVEPIEPVYNDDGSYNTGTLYANPVAMAKEPKHYTQIYRTIGNLFFEYDIIENLTFKSSVNTDILNLREDSFLPTDIGLAVGSNGDGVSGNSNIQRIGLEETLTYNLNVNSHNMKVMAGFSYEDNKEFYTQVEAIQFPSNDFKWITSAAEVDGGDAFTTSYKLSSFFGRVQYDFDKKYLVQFILRADGSSRFGTNNKYGYFPSASLAYRLSEENFIKDISVISDLKVRFSYGTTGNQNIGNFASYGLWSSGNNYLGLPGVAPNQLANPDLRWEKTTTIEGGLNVGLFKDRISLDLSVYQKNTTDLLLERPLTGVSGYTEITENIGKLENNGVELAINTINFETTSGFKWTTNFNISFNRSEITELYNDEPIDAGFANRYAVGRAFGEFYGYKFLEVNSETGDMVFEDLDGEPGITDADRTFIGDPNPDYEGGITNVFSFKGLELSAFFQFVQGNDVYNAVRTYSEAYFFDNMETRVLDRWQQPGDITDVPRAVYANPDIQRVSSYKVEDGSFVRLKSVRIAYNLPSSWLERVKIRSFQIFATGQNLVTWTDYSGPDPEVNYAGTNNTIIGTDFYTYPVAKTYMFGFNLGL